MSSLTGTVVTTGVSKNGQAFLTVKVEGRRPVHVPVDVATARSIWPGDKVLVTTVVEVAEAADRSHAEASSS